LRKIEFDQQLSWAGIRRPWAPFDYGDAVRSPLPVGQIEAEGVIRRFISELAGYDFASNPLCAL
jgi:hypothetical protein